MKLFSVLLGFCLFMPKVYAWGWQEFKDEASSPVSTDAKDVVFYGTLTTMTVLLLEDQIVDPVQKETVRTKPLGSGTSYGNLIGLGWPNAIYIAGQATAGALGNDKGYDRALGMFKATAYASGVTQILKSIVREPRPDNWHQRDSFPSAHTTMAFSFAGYVFEEHGWKWGVPALGMGVYSGFSRMNDNRHFLHDVLAGATIGLSYGVGMSKLQRKKEKLSYMLVPILDHEHRGIGFIKDF